MPEKPEPHAFSRLAEELIGDLRGRPLPEQPSHTLGGARARPAVRPAKPLSSLVEALLEQHQIGRESPEHTIRDHWRAIVGPANAGYSHPAMIERNCLVVLAAHAVVRNELFHHRAEIAARIRKLPGCAHVKALNLRAG
jgi:hypothetical protein